MPTKPRMPTTAEWKAMAKQAQPMYDSQVWEEEVDETIGMDDPDDEEDSPKGTLLAKIFDDEAVVDEDDERK